MFGLLFVLGGIILKDYTILFNLIAAAIVIYFGYSMLKQPYAKYSDKEIKVFGFLGSVRKHYEFKSADTIEIKDNRLYLAGRKLQISSWMVDKKDWQRLLAFYNAEEAFLDELV